MIADVLLRLEVLIALATVVAILKSAWNGWLKRKVIVPLDRLEGMSDQIEKVDSRQEEMYDRQEVHIDAIVALARSMEGDGDFDERQFRERVGRDNDPEDFLQGADSD